MSKKGKQQQAIKNRVKQNIASSRAARSASRYQKTGLNYAKTKLSSKNFDKAMKYRGLSSADSIQLKKSMVQKAGMKVKHAKAGEQFTTTHGAKKSSGIFVSKYSLGKTSKRRINRGALPPSNNATKQTKVVLGRPQNLIYGKIAPQPGFAKQDSKKIPRRGGGQQVITDGGYRTGAVINKPTKYAATSKNNKIKQKVASIKKQDSANKISQSKGKTTQSISKGRSIKRGRNR